MLVFGPARAFRFVCYPVVSKHARSSKFTVYFAEFPVLSIFDNGAQTLADQDSSELVTAFNLSSLMVIPRAQLAPSKVSDETPVQAFARSNLDYLGIYT